MGNCMGSTGLNRTFTQPIKLAIRYDDAHFESNDSYSNALTQL
jgi:hypothetical protein